MGESYLHDFVRCLGTISYYRAGWDYPEMPREEKEREIAEERAALVEARAIWAANPDNHDVLREAFKKARPLASISEFEVQP
jgi:hypothetical protein